jgi:hypothetical protein
MELATAFASIFTPAAAGAGAATAGAAATATGTAALGAGGAAASGGILQTLLQGGATILGMTNAFAAGKADEEAALLAADDTKREVPLETLQGIKRRASIKQEMMDRIGDQDVAYAASGVDLSFGTPGQARKEAFREGDLGLTSDVGTEQTRVARLNEREAAYRKRAARAKSSGIFDAAMIGFNGASSIAGRY